MKIGAEAVVEFRANTVVKKRVVKAYRHAQLDRRIRKLRTAAESRLLARARAAGVSCPSVMSQTDNELVLEKFEGKLLSHVTLTQPILAQIGENIAKLHSADIIHGDLTPANMLWHGKLSIIDFGLGKVSHKPEDKAMDLYLLYQILSASSPKKAGKHWKSIIKAYQHNYLNAPAVLGSFDKIVKRRRYK